MVLCWLCLACLAWLAWLGGCGGRQVGFTVFTDFMAYSGGVYKHVTGSQEGGHAVKVVGWGVENGDEYWYGIIPPAGCAFGRDAAQTCGWRYAAHAHCMRLLLSLLPGSWRTRGLIGGARTDTSALASTTTTASSPKTAVSTAVRPSLAHQPPIAGSQPLSATNPAYGLCLPHPTSPQAT